MDTKILNELCAIVKKYGLGIILFVFFLWQYHALNEERLATQKAFEETTKQTVVVLCKFEDRLSKLEKDSEEHIKELKELRYELRVIGSRVGLPEHRFSKE